MCHPHRCRRSIRTPGSPSCVLGGAPPSWAPDPAGPGRAATLPPWLRTCQGDLGRFATCDSLAWRLNENHVLSLRDAQPQRRGVMARPLLAPIDIRIIQCLHESARSPGSRIATKLGLPESTVRHRLNRLVRLGIIEFAAVVNPLQLGYQIWAQFHLEVQLPKIRSVAQQLARLPEVYFVGITAGGYDVLVGAVFASNAEILNFMAGPMA